MIENSNNKPRVLFAEDCPDTQMMISYILEQEGYDVTVVDNGQECVDKVCGDQTKKEDFDIVLLDVKMPILDGHQTAKMLRGSGFTHPIVALTACCGLKDAEKSIRSGCNDHVSKLVGRENILQALKRNLLDASSSEVDSNSDNIDPVLPIESIVLKDDLSYAPLIKSFLNRLPSIIEELQETVRNQEWEKLEEKLVYFNNANLLGYPLLGKLTLELKSDINSQNYGRCMSCFSEITQVVKRMLLARNKISEIADRFSSELI